LRPAPVEYAARFDARSVELVGAKSVEPGGTTAELAGPVGSVPKLFGCYAALSAVNGALTPIAAWLLASLLGSLAAPALHRPVLIATCGSAPASTGQHRLGTVGRAGGRGTVAHR
jgi:hypothetical protein